MFEVDSKLKFKVVLIFLYGRCMIFDKEKKKKKSISCLYIVHSYPAVYIKLNFLLKDYHMYAVDCSILFLYIMCMVFH